MLSRVSSALLIVLAGVGVGYIARKPSVPAQTAPANLRTASVVKGDISRTVRVSGVIGAERFAAITAPRLRGSRTGSGSTTQLQSQEIVGNAPITVTAP